MPNVQKMDILCTYVKIKKWEKRPGCVHKMNITSKKCVCVERYINVRHSVEVQFYIQNISLTCKNLLG